MADGNASDAETRFRSGLSGIRAGMDDLWVLCRELEERDSQPSLRAAILKMLHDVDELLLRETAPPPTIEREDAKNDPEGIAPVLEETNQVTEPESGG